MNSSPRILLSEYYVKEVNSFANFVTKCREMSEAKKKGKASKSSLSAQRIADELNSCILGLSEVDNDALHEHIADFMGPGFSSSEDSGSSDEGEDLGPESNSDEPMELAAQEALSVPAEPDEGPQFACLFQGQTSLTLSLRQMLKTPQLKKTLLNR